MNDNKKLMLYAVICQFSVFIATLFVIENIYMVLFSSVCTAIGMISVIFIYLNIKYIKKDCHIASDEFSEKYKHLDRLL